VVALEAGDGADGVESEGVHQPSATRRASPPASRR
jgi:hypothetical protein